ncbi:hypothetical protein GCM10009681_23970 [Luedemannella helvata]|uniref:Uncharacterized protein n=1 Tax=Luedemannella helvata TaxID=349315 RepID=A0ABP4WGJ7_9ACTN
MLSSASPMTVIFAVEGVFDPVDVVTSDMTYPRAVSPALGGRSLKKLTRFLERPGVAVPLTCRA